MTGTCVWDKNMCTAVTEFKEEENTHDETILALLLAMLMLLVMASACSTDENGEESNGEEGNETVENNGEATGMKTSSKSAFLSLCRAPTLQAARWSMRAFRLPTP